MKNIKLGILLIIIVFLVSGCDITYNLKIDKNMKINEKITGIEDKKFNDLAHDYLLDRISVIYADKYSGYDEIYKLDYIDDGNIMGNSFEKEYNTLSDFNNNSLVLRDMVKNFNITESDNIINISAKVDDSIYDPRNLAFIITPENININIDLPFKVTHDNADIKKGNIYTWKITKDKRSAEINISFDKNKLSNCIYILNIGINYVILLVIAIVFAISIISLLFYRRIKTLNKI